MHSSISDTLPDHPAAVAEAASETYVTAIRKHNLPTAAEALVKRGLCRIATGEVDEALRDLTEASEIAECCGLEHLHVQAARTIAYIHRSRNELVAAVEWCERGLKCMGSRIPPADAIALLDMLGDIHCRLGDSSRALEYHVQSLRYHGLLDDGAAAGRTLVALGRVHERSGDYNSALGYLSTALRLFREAGDRYQEVRVRTSMSEIHAALGDLTTALEYALTALIIHEHLGDKTSIGGVMITIGNIHEQNGEIEQALAHQIRAYETLGETTADDLRATALLNMGRLYCQLEDYRNARFVFEQALLVAREIEEPQLQYQLHEALSQVYEQNGDLVLALRHHRRYAQIRDELAGIEKQKELAALQVKFDIERAEQEREIYRLKVENLEAEMRRKENELTVAALSLVQKNELLNTLKSQIKQLQAQGDEKEMGREIVDRLLRDIDGSRSADETWKLFEKQLDHVHHDFVRTLAQRFPKLSKTELRVCSLIRIQLSTKDIANLFYTAPRTIERHRYNIGTKLRDVGVDLSSNGGLGTFLMGL